MADLSVWRTPGGGTPYMMGDTYVPRFWPPFLTLWVPNSIFLGYFFLIHQHKNDLLGTNPHKIRSFWSQNTIFPSIFLGPIFSGPRHTPSNFRTDNPPRGRTSRRLREYGTVPDLPSCDKNRMWSGDWLIKQNQLSVSFALTPIMHAVFAWLAALHAWVSKPSCRRARRGDVHIPARLSFFYWSHQFYRSDRVRADEDLFYSMLWAN